MRKSFVQSVLIAALFMMAKKRERERERERESMYGLLKLH
jgi:hypothetical protein